MTYLELSNINYIIDNRPILKGIDLSIGQGDYIAIVGRSGSGKSSLLKLIGDLISPSSGSRAFKGLDYESYRPTDLRRSIAYCFQSPYLFGETILDNLSFPYKIRRQEADLGRIRYLMELFQLDGLDLDRSKAGLSGGELQRLALIRSLIFRPEVLLLDEVTSALDGETTSLVNSIIGNLKQEGTTIVAVSHKPSEIMGQINKLLELESGQIIRREVLV